MSNAFLPIIPSKIPSILSVYLFSYASGLSNSLSASKLLYLFTLELGLYASKSILYLFGSPTLFVTICLSDIVPAVVLFVVGTLVLLILTGAFMLGVFIVGLEIVPVFPLCKLLNKLLFCNAVPV